jgi:Secretion system C-terminal sorting domain
VNGDTLQGKWDIVINPNVNVADPNFGANIPYVYIDADIRGDGNDPLAVGYLSALPNAEVTIYPVGGGASFTVQVSPSILAGGSYAHYEMGTALRGGFWQAGDSIVVKAKYAVNVYNANKVFGSNAVNQSGFYEFTTKNEVYSAYTQKTTQQTAPIAGQTYTCDHYDDINTMSYIALGSSISGILNGCTGTFTASASQSVRNSESGNVFPYEYRLFSIPKKYRIIVMPGAKYIPGSAYFEVPANPINPANITQVGDTLIFDNLNTFFVNNGGSIVPTSSGYYNLTVTFQLQANCSTTTGYYFGENRPTYVGNGVNTPAPGTLYGDFPSASAYAYDYKAPQPTISSTGTVFSTDGTASWNVVVQNQSNTTAADFSWFYITPNGLTNIVVKEGATVITPVSSVYQLGSLAAASTRTFTVTGKINSCAKDSMIINYGTTCFVYPTVAQILGSRANCNRSTTLILDNYPSQVQLTVAKQPVLTGNTTPLCSINTAEFVINSALGAYADNPAFLVAAPTGVTIISGQIEYPLGSGNIQTITPTGSGPFVYRVENHTGVSSRGLPGTIDNPGAAGRQAKLILSFTTTCDFTSGSKFQVRQQGARPCGLQIPTSLGYNGAVRTEPINILGAAGAGSIDVQSLLNPLLGNACGVVTVNGKLRPIIVNTTVSDTVVITLPPGLAYQAGTFSSAGGLTIAAGYPTINTINETIIKLKIPTGIAAGTDLLYQFSVKPDVTSGCGDFPILQEVIRSYPPLFCGAVACPNLSQAIIGTETKLVPVEKYKIGNATLSIQNGINVNFQPGRTAILRLTLENTSATVTIPANTLKVQFYCGTSTGYNAAGLIGSVVTFNSAAIPAAGGTAFYDFSVPIPNIPACLANAGNCVWAVIVPGALNCTCDTVVAALCQLLPVDFESFTARKSNNFAQLNWVAANDYMASKYEVERSADGQNFKLIATIPSTNVGSYSYLDKTPGINNVYRIKATDNNNKVNYSILQIVNFAKDNGGISVFPNPAQNKMNIKFPESIVNKAAQMTVYAADGKIVLTQYYKALDQVKEIDIAILAAGVYNVIVKSDNNIFNTKLIVSK